MFDKSRGSQTFQGGPHVARKLTIPGLNGI
jgi:hypothetical protein